MDFLTYFWLPLLTAFIGWGTNWVAIKMLFRPKEAVSILGIRIRGLIPRRKAAIAAEVAHIIERDILSTHRIKEEFKDIDIKPYLEELAGKLVRNGLGERLKALPFLGGFINDDTLGKLEGMAREAVVGEADSIKGYLGDEIERNIRVRELIEEEIKNLDLDRMEGIVYEAASREFKMIEWVGGILGFAVGVVQLVVLWIQGSLSCGG